ncbi:hypothetical protein GCM10017687_87680 [Streptomyces echinatus]
MRPGRRGGADGGRPARLGGRRDRLACAESPGDGRRPRGHLHAGDSHAEIALAALAAGKHVLCEKPLANSAAEAETMTRAAEEAYGRGQLAMVGFNYRRLPATALARRMVADGGSAPCGTCR